MNESHRKEFEQAALATNPRECVGVLVNVRGKERLHICKNSAVSPDHHFEISAEEWAEIEDTGDVLAIVHSHPGKSPEPSQCDRVSCEEHGVPWHIVGVPTLQWATIEPTGYVAPLKGREFSHGVLDCFTIIRDWFKQERNVIIPNFYRADKWWESGANLYEDNFRSAGFVVVPEDAPYEVGDCFLIQLLANVANHAAVMTRPGVILHHVVGRLSCEEVYGGYWQKHTRLRVRYAGN